MVRIVWAVADTWTDRNVETLALFSREGDAIAFAREQNAATMVPRYQVERRHVVNGVTV